MKAAGKEMASERLKKINEEVRMIESMTGGYGYHCLSGETILWIVDEVAERAKLLALLSGLEWVGLGCSNGCRRVDAVFCVAQLHCPSCEMAQIKGHADGCEIKEVLK